MSSAVAVRASGFEEGGVIGEVEWQWENAKMRWERKAGWWG